MSKATKKSILYALGVLALIAFAMWLRYASRHIFHSPAVSHLRSGIYVFLFSVWCYSLWIRIVQTQVRRYLLAISALMVLWILLRSIKFSIENTDAERRLWYLYFPMCSPMLSSCFRRWATERIFGCPMEQILYDPRCCSSARSDNDCTEVFLRPAFYR